MPDRTTRLERARERRGWTRKELAARAGVTYEGVRALETGDRDGRLSTWEKLAVALGVTAESLLGDGSDENEVAPIASLRYDRHSALVRLYQGNAPVALLDLLSQTGGSEPFAVAVEEDVGGQFGAGDVLHFERGRPPFPGAVVIVHHERTSALALYRMGQRGTVTTLEPLQSSGSVLVFEPSQTTVIAVAVKRVQDLT